MVMPPKVVRQRDGSTPFSPSRVAVDLSMDTPSPARPKRSPSGCPSASADDHRRRDTKDSPQRVRKQVSHRQHCPLLHAVFRYVVRYPAADALTRANTHAPAAMR